MVDRMKQPLSVRLVALLMTAVVSGMGLWAALEQHILLHGRRGADTSIDGDAAVAMGLAQMALGAVPMAFWASNGRQAGWWAAGCMALTAVAFAVSMHLSP